MKQVTIVAPANIAFIKYWGQKDKEKIMPYHGSISMNLSNCLTTTTAMFNEQSTKDEIVLKDYDGTIETLNPEENIKNKKLYQQINRIRNIAQRTESVSIQTHNSFPSKCGIASSASGGAALTLALCKIFELDKYITNLKKLSALTRLCGSASAMRSLCNGFGEIIVEGDQCFAKNVTPKDFQLINIVVIVDPKAKANSSSNGHLLAETSPFFAARLEQIDQRLEYCKEALKHKDFTTLGTIIEQDCISMHSVMMTSTPPLYYWNHKSFIIMEAVKQWRNEGIESYFTIDAGANVHVLCEPKYLDELTKKLYATTCVKDLIINHPCQGARII
jgi:diphosphomevalonate decarboxylase